jgi:multidrug efflux pump subunit AcrA (membrane-fusion protein)
MEVLTEKDKWVDPWDSGKSGLFELADLSAFLVKLDVPQKDRRHVRLKQAARMEIPEVPGTEVKGAVLEIDSQIDPATDCFRVRIGTVPNDDGILFPGMRALISWVEDEPVEANPPNNAIPRKRSAGR